MTGHHPSTLARLILCGSVVALGIIGGCNWSSPKPIVVPPATPDGGWNVSFQDRARESGVVYAPGPRGKPPLTILGTAPGGGAFVDLNQDGWLDIVLAAPPKAAVFSNQGDGSFKDVSNQFGLTREGFWMGCTVGDLDNDGDPDLFLTGYRCCALLRNDGGRKLTDITESAGIASHLWTTSAAFADVDLDGWLDLYVGAYVRYEKGQRDHCLQGSILTACGPEEYPAEIGKLYRNLRGSRFADVTKSAGLARCDGKTWGVAFADYDQDGRPDLYLANDQTPGNLYRNLGSFRFEEVGAASGTAYDGNGSVQGGMGVDWGDQDGDGWLDLFVTTFMQQDKQIYRNNHRGTFDLVSDEVGLNLPTRPYVAFGGGFLDANNDGRQDLFIANGHVRDNSAEIDSGQSYAQPLQLFAGQEEGHLVDVSARSGGPFATPSVGRGVAFGDYDNDGWEDILVVDLEGPARLLRNEGGSAGHNWCIVKLDGGQSNPEGIGAVVKLETDQGIQVRQVTRGRSLLSASDVRLHFGLAGAQKINRLIVRWPDGKTEEWSGIASKRIVTLRKGGGTGRTIKEPSTRRGGN